MKRILSICLAALALSGTPALAAGEAGEAVRKDWSFAGLFGTFNTLQLQRGFQVYREVCTSCHGIELVAFRNLSEPGGPEYTEDQIKLLASQYLVPDEESPGDERPAIPADRWPDPFPNDQIARDANSGVVPPDLSVMAKARTIETPFPWWILNYFTAYQEGGPDYIYNLLVSYPEEAPEGVDLQPGQYYNEFFPGHLIAMPSPLFDGMVDYEGDAVPETVEQYSEDVSAFLMWTAEPHLVERKTLGFQVLLFLVLFSVLMYLTYRRLWRNVDH